mmetsp:Transcript_6052/g.17105  ORF Transcript_6052/g.17105 Transcript_6052/m.17105 type:complete len:226 (-) Transcript_6052:191-868(-)
MPKRSSASLIPALSARTSSGGGRDEADRGRFVLACNLARFAIRTLFTESTTNFSALGCLNPITGTSAEMLFLTAFVSHDRRGTGKRSSTTKRPNHAAWTGYAAIASLIFASTAALPALPSATNEICFLSNSERTGASRFMKLASSTVSMKWIGFAHAISAPGRNKVGICRHSAKLNPETITISKRHKAGKSVGSTWNTFFLLPNSPDSTTDRALFQDKVGTRGPR